MRHIYISLLVVFAAPIFAQAQIQTPAPPPQTARQALIEMFLGKSADAFEKHLPEVTRSALIRKGETPETSMVQKISMMGHGLADGGRHVETFDVGPNLLVSEQEEGKEKVEVTVEHDSLMGEQDEIELSIHAYSNGEPQFLPVIPRLIFSMTQEKDIWRLSEVTVAAHIPLTDPDYLKGVRRKADEVNENMASGRVTMIVAAEMRYASAHPEHGYACHLADLFDKADTNNIPPQVPGGFPPDLSGDESNGYHFSVSGCDGSPAPKFQITAVPTESDSGMKAFCADESGRVRFDSNGSGTACVSGGKFLDQATPVLPGPTD
ncbi:MAG: hypothetical protein WBC78_07030 [Candidatus Sulfotelmatobacter sp.]